MKQGFANNSYHRPNQAWTCTAEPGCGCPNGPSPGGKCATRSQCEPILEDDHWTCNRSANRGGACDKGPDPFGNCCYETIGCVPARSLRSKRKIFVVCFVALITGILLVGIWGPNRNEFLAPGGLSSHHAQIWSGPNAEDRCIACHDAGASGPFGWLVSVVGGKPHAGQPQYKKCLNCHKQSISPKNALYVHNLPPERLKQLTAMKKEDPAYNSHGAQGIFGSPANHQGELACANCHREHHGKNHDLAAMTDQQCQSCHAGQFESFEHGHPEFKSFAQTYQTGIQFDHFVHQSKYFAEANQSFDCNSCHTGDEQNNVMQVASFEKACASCHQKTIDASLTQGMPIFSLPSIDVDWLREKGLDVGQWPESASGSFDGTVPPMMKVLLAGDPRASKAMQQLGADFDLFDIDADDIQQLAAVQQLAIAIKSLLYDLSSQGQAGLVDRLDSLTNRQLSTSRLQRMVAGLNSETFSVAQRKWFPNLEEERERLKLKGGVAGNFPAHSILNNSSPDSNYASQASYVQDDDELLIENPLRKLYQSIPDSGALPDDSNKGADNGNRIKFEDLPQSVTGREPVNPQSSAQDNESKQGQLPNSVENRFYYPKTESNPGSTVQSQEDNNQLAPNPVANKNPTEIEFRAPQNGPKNGPKKIDNPYLNPSGSVETKPKKAADLEPAVIRDDSFRKIPDQEKLANNPLAELLNKSSDKQKPNVKQTGPSQNSNSDTNSNKSKSLVVESNADQHDANQDNREIGLNKPDLIPHNDDQKASTNYKKPKNKPATKILDIDRLPPDKRVALGGWYVDDESLTVAYRQTGHADALTQNWYDFVVAIREPRLDPALSNLKNIANRPTSPGLCASCHRQVEDEDLSVKFQWKSVNRRASHRGFTRFSHRPHLVQPGENKCTTCHVLDSGSSQLAKLDSQSRSLDCRSEFLPITKNNCVSCHNQQSKIQNCTQCHNYHIDFSTTALTLPLTLTSQREKR